MREGTFLAARAASLTCFQSFRGSAYKTIQHLQANLHLPLNLASCAGYNLTRLMFHHNVNNRTLIMTRRVSDRRLLTNQTNVTFLEKLTLT